MLRRRTQACFAVIACTPAVLAPGFVVLVVVVLEADSRAGGAASTQPATTSPPSSPSDSRRCKRLARPGPRRLPERPCPSLKVMQRRGDRCSTRSVGVPRAWLIHGIRAFAACRSPPPPTRFLRLRHLSSNGPELPRKPSNLSPRPSPKTLALVAFVCWRDRSATLSAFRALGARTA